MTNRFLNLKQTFEQSANPEKAQKMSAYMRHQFTFYGIPTPERRKIYHELIATDKKAKQIDWNLLDLAWAESHRELHYFVCDYLKGLQKVLTYEDVSKLIAYASSKEWWDTIDHFDRIFGNIADARIPKLMIDFSLADNFWLRRIAIDHQLGKKDKTDTTLLKQIIVNNLGSNEFFINKAIGWALRDYSKTNPNWVRQFIKDYQNQLAPLSIREGSKHI
ncbi:DNA alkylation repair protein [Streptococcus hillyeri]|uniref:DNA alkylation repair protein n=1 Tax=Streptococcus hillyeri TaxID=2282420 RepID=A0A3L9E2C9_9STRE|nr:DNA alkylation repair protein [Streptococcus hillyeri]RLY05300.1 DNA alkylation repair protein [Streptococcus hillyeri]